VLVTEAAEHHQLERHLESIWSISFRGQCYNHYFWRILPIFGEKMAFS
jgi:hypothetical protein